jgi:hypothetical protein
MSKHQYIAWKMSLIYKPKKHLSVKSLLGTYILPYKLFGIQSTLLRISVYLDKIHLNMIF